MSDGYGYVNPAAFEALNLSWGDTALANEFGTTASASGSDSIHNTAKGINTGPETLPNPSLLDRYLTWDTWSGWYERNFSPEAQKEGVALDPLGILPKMKVPGLSADSSAPSASKASTNWKNIGGSLLLIVIGLIVLSKALSMVGEDSAEIVARFARKGE